MNLLDKKRWNFEFPWGSIINPDTDKEICMSQNRVDFRQDGSVHLGCSHAPCTGWKTGKNGTPAEVKTDWSVGALISKDEYRSHFGTYSFKFRLPDFRGAWPAIWLIDLHPSPPGGDGMGMPPEIDIFEHFRKDGFLSRFHTTHSFHQGPTYENNTITEKTYWKLWPLDWSDTELIFTWTTSEMTWILNGKKILTVRSDTPKYPTKPMNLVINSGLGLDWKPKVEKFEDFVVYKAEYQK